MRAAIESMWNDSEKLEMIGWMLVHSLWLLLIPAAMLGILLLAMPQEWSRAKYNAGLAALLLMIMLPLTVVPYLSRQVTLEVDSSVVILQPPLESAVGSCSKRAVPPRTVLQVPRPSAFFGQWEKTSPSS